MGNASPRETSNRDRLTWPPCTSKCGIFLEDPEIVAWADGDRVHVHNRSVATLCLASAKRETPKHECVVAWTDGACVCNQDSRFRSAGCGVFFSISDNTNCSSTLPGREQTANRAELSAVTAGTHWEGLNASRRRTNVHKMM